MDIEANPRYIAFDAVEIDLVSRRVAVAGIETPLEPKAFDVLALIAQAPGKAFARDEILDTVWGHRHVTPGVLNRVITLIRQALGDSARALHTLHGVGYRLDGEIRFFSHREAASAATPANGDSTDSVAPAPVAAVPSAVPEPGTPSPEPADPNPQSAASPAAPAAIRPASRRWSLLTVAALAVVAAGVFLWHAQHRETTAMPAQASPTLVVLPLRAIGADKDETAFADGLSEELTTRLARVEGLRLISSTSATRAQHDGFDAAQLAERLHVTHALEGSLREEGDQLRIDLRLIETPSGRTVWAQDYDRKLADVFALQQDIAQAVASALTLHIGLTQSTAPAPNPQVFREYLQLRHIFLTQADDATNAKAETDLDALAARAPDFAPAHGLLALNLASGFEGDGRENDALREARHTLTVDPNDVYAHATLGMLAQKNRDWATVKKQFDIALALNPSDAVMHNITGMWLGRLGYGDLAVAQSQIAYAADPLGYWVVYNLGVQLDVTGQHDAAQRYLDKLPGLQNEPIAHTADARWRNAIWRHDFTTARDIAAHASNEMGMADALAALTGALLDSSQWPQADAAIAAHEAKFHFTSRLRFFEPQPNAEALLATFETGTQQPNGKLLWAVEFSAVRHDPAFQGFLKRMKFIDYWNANGWPPQCKPDGDGAKCD